MKPEIIDLIKYIAGSIIYVAGLVVGYRETLNFLVKKAAEKSVGITKIRELEEVNKQMEIVQTAQANQIKQIFTELQEARHDLREIMSDFKDAFFGKK